jgi:hypothetical protein
MRAHEMTNNDLSELLRDDDPELAGVKVDPSTLDDGYGEDSGFECAGECGTSLDEGVSDNLAEEIHDNEIDDSGFAIILLCKNCVKKVLGK